MTASTLDYPEGRRDRAAIILGIARAHTGQKLTVPELATLCDRIPNGGFGRDLSLARHMALDAGERITECAWDRERQLRCLVHLYAGRERGLGIDGLLVHAADVSTRARNLGRHSEWEHAYADDALDRKFAAVTEHAGKAFAEYGLAIEELREVIREMRRT